jgi:hypothetical protein
MDAKVHLARPGHRDAEEMIGLARRDLRRQRAGESADQDADHLGVAARRNFLESYPELDRDFHPSASADAALDGSLVRQTHSMKPQLAASADREQVAPVVAVAKVVGHPEPAHWVAERLKAARHADATALQVEVQESGAKQQEGEQALPKRLEAPAPQQVQEAEALVARQLAVQVRPRVQKEQAEPPPVQAKQQVQLGLASEQQPEVQQQRAPRAQPASELRPLAAVPPVPQQARSAPAQQAPE